MRKPNRSARKNRNVCAIKEICLSVTNPSAGKILVFSAPSGAGKTTLLDNLRIAYPELIYSISATTRKPRPGERHGEHYFFLDREEFEQKIARNEFAEWEEVHGNLYGTPRSFIDQTIDSGKHVVMDIDVKGKLTFDKTYPEAIGILVVPPSTGELERRLRNRKTESEEALRTRIANAAMEMDLARRKGKYEHVIVNDSLDRAKEDTVRLVGTIIGKR